MAGMRLFMPCLCVFMLIACGQQDRQLVVSGRVEIDDVHVGSKIGGRVVAVLAEEGDVAEAGQVLVHLDANELTAQMAQAQSALAQTQAQLDLLLAGTRREDLERAEAAVRAREAELELRLKGFRSEEIQSARAQLEQAQSDLELAEREYERGRLLYENRTIGQQELDRLRTAYQTAQAQLNVARQQVELLESGSRPEEIAQARAMLEQSQAELASLRAGAREEEIAAQRAAVAQAEASIARIQAQLDETVIAAPAAARIESLQLEPGDLVSAGQTMAVLALRTPPYVRCYVPEDRLGWVRPGREVWIQVDAFPDERFDGQVRFVASEAEFTPRNVQTTAKRAELVFETKVDILDNDPRLRPGMFADVHIAPPSEP